jgi:hypothetical protein
MAPLYPISFMERPLDRKRPYYIGVIEAGVILIVILLLEHIFGGWIMPAIFFLIGIVCGFRPKWIGAIWNREFENELEERHYQIIRAMGVLAVVNGILYALLLTSS